MALDCECVTSLLNAFVEWSGRGSTNGVGGRLVTLKFLRTLKRLAHVNIVNVHAIREGGGLLLLVDLLRGGDGAESPVADVVVQTAAASVLATLAYDKGTVDALLELDVIRLIARLLLEHDEVHVSLCRTALNVLQSMTMDDNACAALCQLPLAVVAIATVLCRSSRQGREATNDANEVAVIASDILGGLLEWSRRDAELAFVICTTGVVPCLLNRLSDASTQHAGFYVYLLYGLSSTRWIDLGAAGVIAPLLRILEIGLTTMAGMYALGILTDLAEKEEVHRATIRRECPGWMQLLTTHIATDARKATVTLLVVRLLAAFVRDDDSDAVATAAELRDCYITRRMFMLLPRLSTRSALRTACIQLTLQIGTLHHPSAVDISLLIQTMKDSPKAMEVRDDLVRCMGVRLWNAECTGDIDVIGRAHRMATLIRVPSSELERSRRTLSELERSERRRKERHALGLDALSWPHEFVCPITLDKFDDPVMVSDGHTYERRAILTVLATDTRRSPLTREMLRVDVLYPNRTLKKVMEGYEDEMLRSARKAHAIVGVGAPNLTGAKRLRGDRGAVLPDRSR